MQILNNVDIDLKSLRILEALLTERSVSRAARKVGLSQPAVSHALRKLREQLRDPLLVRTQTGMVLTARAEAMKAPLLSAIKALRAAIDPGAGSFDPATSREAFNIATTDYVQFLTIPSLTGHLSQVAPWVRLDFAAMRESIPRRELERGEIDLAIGYFEQAPESLFQQTLFTDEFVCCQRKGPAALRATPSPEVFASFRHVMVVPWKGMVGLVDPLLAKQGITRRVVLSTSHFLVAPFIVAASDCVLTLPRRVAEIMSTYLPLTLFSPPLDLPRLTISQIWHERVHHDPAQQWLRSQIAKISPKDEQRLAA